MKSKKILIVEDLISMQHLIKSSLESANHGFEITKSISDGKLARSYLRANKPDLIISGWELPNLTGLELLNFVRSDPRLSDIPFLMLTARGDKVSIVSAIRAGVDGYIVKPFRVGGLIKYADELLLEGYKRSSVSDVTSWILNFFEAESSKHNFTAEEIVEIKRGGQCSTKAELQDRPAVLKSDVVLIVDDVPENIGLIASVLDGTCKTKVATRGSKALEIANKAPPDLILLDIMMPEMDGYEVCRRLKASSKTVNIPVIFISAKSEVVDIVKGYDVGAVDYMTKPLSVPILKAKIKTHIGLSKK